MERKEARKGGGVVWLSRGIERTGGSHEPGMSKTEGLFVEKGNSGLSNLPG